MTARRIKKSIFDEVAIGRTVLPGRIVRAPTWEGMATEDGHCTSELVGLYTEIAAGKPGLIITGYSAVIGGPPSSPRMMSIYDDSFIEGYRLLTAAVHDAGSLVALQIAYGGSQTFNNPGDGPVWGPSAVRHPQTGMVPARISNSEIAVLVSRYGDAAARALDAGFDAICIHAAAGYFLHQFLSPYFNRRTDEYGGSLENRVRLLEEVCSEVMLRTYGRVPVIVKINCSDFATGGLEFADSMTICRRLADLGVDALEIAGGLVYDTSIDHLRYHITRPDDEAYFAPWAAAIASSVPVPVILEGGLRSPAVMQKLLSDTDIALFALSRPFICEPGLMARWRAGDLSKARCTSCGRCVGENSRIGCVLSERGEG